MCRHAALALLKLPLATRAVVAPLRGLPLILGRLFAQRPLAASLSAARSVALAAVLAGCGAPPAEPSLFPLGKGHVWTYRVTAELEGEAPASHELTLRTLGNEALPLPGGGNAWRRRSDDGVDYWLRSDSSGIYRVASKNDLMAEPQADRPVRFVLKAPFEVGTQWQASTTPYLLMRRSDFPREMRHKHKNVSMQYRIEAAGIVLDTSAGRFNNCLRVKGDASVRIYVDPISGWRDLPLTTLEWYCPGVGLARLERLEPVGSTFLTGGTLTMELASWQ